MAGTNDARFIRRFFEETEKVDLEDEFAFDLNGTQHVMSYGVVVEGIKGTPRSERSKIVSMLRKIDFQNSDVGHYLRFLGTCMARVRYAG